MLGGITMRNVVYIKPNMNNLKGKRGRKAFEQICSLQPASRENLKKEADACMERILARRKNERITRN